MKQIITSMGYLGYMRLFPSISVYVNQPYCPDVDDEETEIPCREKKALVEVKTTSGTPLLCLWEVHSAGSSCRAMPYSSNGIWEIRRNQILW